MNQILITKKNDYLCNNLKYLNKKKKKKYIIAFSFSIIICMYGLFYLVCSLFSKINNINKSEILKLKYNLSTLYSENNHYNEIKLSDEISIIGLIEIPKLNISYPILQNSNENLLKISVCKFSGPMPNKYGNLCIAGHNYKNNMMFSKIHKLDIGDSIYITDLNNVRLEYIVYKNFKVKENNLECTTDSNCIEITLITCNNSNNAERSIIKAKVKG